MGGEYFKYISAQIDIMWLFIGQLKFRSRRIHEGERHLSLPSDQSSSPNPELTEMTPKMWVRFRFLWTRRRQDKGLPAPPLPPTSNSTLPTVGPEPTNHGLVTPNIERLRYPAIEFYHTREETIARKQQRRASAGVLPQAAVERAWIRMQNNSQNQGAMGIEPHS